MLLAPLVHLIVIWVLTIGAVLLPILLLKSRRTRTWGVAYVILYVGVYLVLTLKGDYVAHITGSSFGGAGGETVRIDYYWWCPLNCGKGSGVDRLSGRLMQKESLTAHFFGSLLSLDRAFFHPDLPYQP